MQTHISCKFFILTKSCILVAYHGELVSSWSSCSTLERVAFTPNGETQFRKPKRHYWINQIKNKNIIVSFDGYTTKHDLTILTLHQSL